MLNKCSGKRVIKSAMTYLSIDILVPVMVVNEGLSVPAVAQEAEADLAGR